MYIKRTIEKRNTSILIELMKRIKSFNAFVILCNINETSLRIAADKFFYMKLQPGEYLFHKNDESDCLYGIISGTMTLELFYTVDTWEKRDDVFGNRVERLVNTYELKEGFLFGELGVIYNIKRTGSIYAKTEVELFCIDKSNFNDNFKKSYMLADKNRKTVVKSVIRDLENVYPSHRQELLYRRMRTAVS